MRGLILRGAVVALACGAVGLACGSNVEEGAGATAGGGGSGAGSQSTVQPTTDATSSSRSSTGTAEPSTSTGPGSPCAALAFEADCLAAFPSCVPLYDDSCCPTCDPVGGCADCQNEDFYACKDRAEVCSTPPTCGTTPAWACQGKSAACPMIQGDDTYDCEKTAGCAVATCSPDVNCVDRECHPVRADSCSADCHSLPPSCPAGRTAEAKNGCWTGFCIDAAVCGVF